MLDLGDHAAGLRRVGQLRYPIHPVEPEPDQGLALVVLAAGGASDLPHLDLRSTGHAVLPAPAALALVRRRVGTAVPATRLQGRDLQIAPCRNRARAVLPLERVEGR